MKTRMMAVLMGAILFAAPALADHWPINPRLGMPPEVIVYLHKAVSGGPLFSTMVISCRRPVPYCEGVENHMGMLAFYRTAEGRDEADTKDWVGTGYFDLIDAGAEMKFGKMFMFVYADGRPGWHRQSMVSL